MGGVCLTHYVPCLAAGPRASLLGVWTVFSLRPHGVILCPHLLLHGHQSYGIRAPPVTSVYINLLFKDSSLKTAPF